MHLLINVIYNASFDKRHLPELHDGFSWRDIMKVAAYKQHNPHIPNHMPCCGTGRLRRGYGVEQMLRILGKKIILKLIMQL